MTHTKESDAETLLNSGIVLTAATECSCDTCTEIILGVDKDFYTVCVRFAKLRKTKPSLMFKILAEEWCKERILKELPELYN